jgi:hypothetical protein
LPVPGLGLELTVHEMPFHVSIRVWNISDVSSYDPTATQKVELTHWTPSNVLKELLGSTLSNSDQIEPLHDSIRVLGVDAPWVPTAMQKVELAHDTAANVLVEPPRSGVGVTDQLGFAAAATPISIPVELSDATTTAAHIRIGKLALEIPIRRWALPERMSVAPGPCETFDMA